MSTWPKAPPPEDLGAFRAWLKTLGYQDLPLTDEWQFLRLRLDAAFSGYSDSLPPDLIAYKRSKGHFLRWQPEFLGLYYDFLKGLKK